MQLNGVVGPLDPCTVNLDGLRQLAKGRGREKNINLGISLRCHASGGLGLRDQQPRAPRHARHLQAC
eukprot:258119-Pyramimonas_sp.AAC.1